MSKKIVSLLTAIFMMMTIFAVPATSLADTNAADPSAATEYQNDAENPAATLNEDSTETDGTIQPSGLTDSTDPTDPTDPTEPTDPTDPTDPEEPSGPEEDPVVPVEPVSLSKASVTIKYATYSFTKKQIKPAVTVKLGGKTLKQGTDYTVKYTNNIYPGTAKITVTGKAPNYKGTKTKTFAIATPANVKWKASTTSSIKMDWTSRKNVTGYKVYRYNVSKSKWVLLKTVSSSEITIKDLNAGIGYSFRIKSYYKTGNKTYYSPATSTIKIPTKPTKVTIKSVLNHPSLYAKVSWGKKTSSGYQVKLARNSSFTKNAKTFKVTSASTLSRKIQNLKDNQQYYVKVRAYKTYGNRTTYGAWSKSKAFSTNGTRWYKVNGKQYYYTKGKLFKGTKMFGKHKYYFNSDDGAWSGASSTMWSKVKNSSSKTKYLIAVSRELNRICVYQGKKGDWKLKSYWMCSTGRPENGKISKTPTGSWLMPKEDNHLGYIGGHKDYTCWYATRFYGRCFFHSVIYEPASKTRIQDGRLGMNISDGCIRMDIENAKWIYDNCHTGTRVIVY